ncbi:Pc13g15690 [Penicillium rubens Wisconsin 54-1255]|uniref:Carboxylic ester hydrolase n=1 Tax=Penicillium rubens (strain ATCC 28089 / DSM 1075 / NRRL 1951 / Wisconsin 54-1255) TaxID=500485 RepID=B6H303_PENRW|nr:Pc13g15690 [Penicillium rubens Wisconsin 54-1255]
MHLSLVLCAFGSNVAALAGPQSPELHVVTSSGSVNGIYNNSAHTVRAFLGIPYAEPPVGQLRWAPSRPKSPPRSPIDASSFSSPCPHVYRYSNESIWNVLPYMIWNSGDMSEDCLYMNIWAPSIEHRGNGEVHKAAVMMFIHGGSYDTGGSSVAYYDGTNLVQDHDDLIVVTCNYRLNVFGFPNAPDLDPSKQNLGLLDQRLAIEWVYENIAKFGGDPDRILLFGHSAGAASADIHSYAYPDNPIVRAIALHSGTAPLLTSAPDHRNWNELSTAVGCGVGAQSFQCMKKVPAMKIVETRARGNYTFHPIVDNVLVFSDYGARAEMGKLARLPTLAGITGREYSAFLPLSQTSVDEIAIHVLGQQIYNCPLRESVRIRVDHQVPTWRYVYHGNFTNLSPIPWLGAYHGSEIPMVFGTYNISAIPSSAREVEVSQYMQGAWVAFAKDPRGLSEYGWPEFSFDGISLSLSFSLLHFF